MISGHKWHHVDETERRRWQDPEAILQEIGMGPGLTFADIGCGQGFFTLPAARLAGAAGKIYGVDSDAGAIQELRKKAAAEGLDNIELKTGPAEDVLLCRSCVDIVFFGIVLHDFQDPLQVLINASQMLKSGGRLINLDWKKQAMSFGPPLGKRFDEAAASRLIESAGFTVLNVRPSGEYHYLITAGLRPD